MNPRRAPQPAARSSLYLLLALLALLVAAVLFAYQAAPANGFHLDDEPNILDVRAIHAERLDVASLTSAAFSGANHRRILANASFAVDWWRGGGDPRPFQLTNIGLHAVSAVLVALVLLQLLRVARPRDPVPVQAWIAVLCAALWALHPIQVQSVTYIVQRMAAMATLFTLGALACYLQGRLGRGRGWPWFAASGLCLLLGALSKENAWMAPALLLLAEYGVVRHADASLVRRPLDRWLIAAPFAVGLLLVADVLLQGPFYQWGVGGYGSRDFTMAERLWTQPRVIAFHLGQLVWPLPGRFSIEHDFVVSTGWATPWTTLVAIGGLLAWVLAGLALLLRPGRRILGTLLLWVPLMLVVESSVIPLEMVFEHRMQLPSVALAGLVAVGLARLGPGVVRGAVHGLVLTAVLLVGWSTMERLPLWRDNLTLYTAALDHAPNSQRVQYNVANALREAGRHEEAVVHYRNAIAIGPDKSAVMNNYATSLRALQRYDEAAEVLERSLEIDAGHLNSIVNLGTVLLELGRHEEGDARFREALQMAPGYIAIYRRYAETLADAGRLDDARRVLQAGLQRRPDAVSLRRMLDRLPESQGLPRLDLAELDRLAAAQPGDARIQVMRGVALGRAGRTGPAIEAFVAALRIEPDNVLAHGYLGRLFASVGEVELARRHLTEALRLDPSLERVRDDLARLSAE